MLRHVLVLVCLLMPWAIRAEGRADTKEQPGWPGVFPNLPNYDARYESPVVERKGGPRVYRQKAAYTWLGGRFEVVEITLARDTAFKEKYSSAAMKKEKNTPDALKLNKKKAWKWTFPREEGHLDQVRQRLVVVLDADKVIVLEQKGSGLDLENLAKQLDFPKLEKALDQPPRK